MIIKEEKVIPGVGIGKICESIGIGSTLQDVKDKVHE